MSFLEVRNLTKRFGGLAAVQNLDFDLKKGEILGLIGPNGAGKTTIFNLICGIHRKTAGEIFFSGRNVTRLSPDRVAACGVIRTFQDKSLFDDFTVSENVLIGFHLQASKSLWRTIVHSKGLRLQEEMFEKKALEILDFVGLAGLSSELAKNLSYGHQSALGIAVALAAEPRLILLDEPVTGMNAKETLAMMNLIREIRQRGCSILLVEHAMRVVMGICDRIVVVSFGQKIAEGPPEDIQNNQEVIEAYLGLEEEDDDLFLD